MRTSSGTKARISALQRGQRVVCHTQVTRSPVAMLVVKLSPSATYSRKMAWFYTEGHCQRIDDRLPTRPIFTVIY